MNEHRPWSINDITSQHGRRVITTGANSGIGYHTAATLARKGAEVVLACRDEQRGAEALSCLERERHCQVAGDVAVKCRFSLSLRDIEELLLERGVVVTYETIRCWCDKFGAGFARCAKAARRKRGSTWHLDEMFVKLRASHICFGARSTSMVPELDVLVQKRREVRGQALLPAHVAFKPSAEEDRCRPAAQLSGDEG